MTTAGDVGSATTGSTAPMVRYGQKPLRRKKPLKGQEKKMKTFREYTEEIVEGAKFKKVKKFVADKQGNLKKVIKKECQDQEGNKVPGFKIVDGKKCQKMSPDDQKNKNKNEKRAEKIKGKKIAKGLIKAPAIVENFRDAVMSSVEEKIKTTDYMMNRGNYKDKQGKEVSIVTMVKKVGQKDAITLKGQRKEYTIALDIFKAQYTQI